MAARIGAAARVSVATRWVAGLVLAGMLGLTSGRVHAQSLETMRSVRTAQYEVYAPTEEMLRSATADLEHAVERFREMTGVEPGGLAVVVLDDPAHAVNFSARELSARGLRVLPWLTHEAMEKAVTEAGAVGGQSVTNRTIESRVLAHEACHAFLVKHVNGRFAETGQQSQPRGRVYGHAEVPDWLDEAVAIACESASARQDRIARLRSQPGGAFTLAELFTMAHPLSGNAALRGNSPRQDSAQGIPRASGRAVIRRADGTEVALDSTGVATLIDTLRQTGVTMMRADSGGISAPRTGSRTTMRVMPSSQVPPDVAQRATVFYSQAAAVTAFLEQHEGPDVLGRLIESIVAGKRGMEVTGALRTLPTSIETLEQRWRDWLAHH